MPSVGFEPTTSCIRGKRLTARPQVSHGRERTTPTLAANEGGRGFESDRGHKILFFTFYFIRVKCEELFCKTNIKLLRLQSILQLKLSKIDGKWKFLMRNLDYFEKNNQEFCANFSYERFFNNLLLNF